MGMAYSKSHSTMVPRRKNLFKAIFTKKLAPRDSNNKSLPQLLNLTSNPIPESNRFSNAAVSY